MASKIEVGSRWRVFWTDYDMQSKKLPDELHKASNGIYETWGDLSGLVVVCHKADGYGILDENQFWGQYEGLESFEGKTIEFVFNTGDAYGYAEQIHTQVRPSFKCVCPTAHSCACGAFAAEMVAQGRTYNKWTKSWSKSK